MDARYPKNGKRQRPRIMQDNPGSLEPNCEGIFLDFKDGRIVSKAYSPD
jgi:hypothetical protein